MILYGDRRVEKNCDVQEKILLVYVCYLTWLVKLVRSRKLNKNIIYNYDVALFCRLVNLHII